jgi:hypothetical protein
MSSTHDVISALLDNEPFDPQELVAALSEPAGRALLIDLVALRHIVQPSDAAPPIGRATVVRQRRWPLLAAAAAMLIALAGGYAAGIRQAVDTPAGAPPATRVVQAMPFTPTGGNQ